MPAVNPGDNHVDAKIRRRHPELDAQQLRFIGHGEGPLLGLAGPGAGKTRCIELRAVNLLLTGRVSPEELTLCTFGKPAARELRERFLASAQALGCGGDAARVRIATIHSLCHQILVPHARALGLDPPYRLLDQDDQGRLMRERFNDIFGPDRDVLENRGWRDERDIIYQARRYFDRMADERISLDELADSPRAFDAALGRCCLRYRWALWGFNALDFAHLQVLAARLLCDSRIAGRIGGAMRYIMVDEYQDTSHIQQEILLRLAEAHGNLAVVGDDDQAIYRFRGASVQNLLQFPDRFPNAQIVGLTRNYRSHSGIVEGYNRWMPSAADWAHPDRPDVSFRYEKTIVAHAPESHAAYPSVIAMSGSSPYDEGRQLAELFRFLKSAGVITDYGQAALLLHSVKDRVAGPYLDALEDAGVPTRHVAAGAGDDAGDGRSGAEVLVTTIHQAKGREWPVVAVGGLDNPGRHDDPVGAHLARYCPHDPFEPADRIAAFDRARVYYVAFSRPRGLLALSATGRPHRIFDSIWEGLPRWPDIDRAALGAQRFIDDHSAGAGAPPPDLAPDLVIDLDRMESLTVRLGM